MRTIEHIEVSVPVFSTGTTGLGSHIRVNLSDHDTLDSSFVADELLQLEETPAMQPSVQSLSPSLSSFPDAFKIFQDNMVSTGTINDSFADIVVDPGHVTFLPTRDLLQESLGGLCAFSLELMPQFLKLHQPCLVTFEYPTVTTDGQVVYSEVDPNFLVATRSNGSGLSGERNVCKESTFAVCDKLKILIAPVEIFPVIHRNFNWDIFPLPGSERSNPNVAAIESKQVTVESDRAGFHHRFDLELSGSQVLSSNTDCTTSEIGSQPLSQVPVNQLMQIETVVDFGLVTNVDSILDCMLKSFCHVGQLFVGAEFQLYGRNEFHTESNSIGIYKHYAQMSNDYEEVSVNSATD